MFYLLWNYQFYNVLFSSLILLNKMLHHGRGPLSLPKFKKKVCLCFWLDCYVRSKVILLFFFSCLNW